MDTRGVREGMTVYSSDSEKLGKVVQCADDFFLIEKGFFFPKDYIARYDQVSDITGDDIRLRETADALGTPGGATTWSEHETTERTTAGTTLSGSGTNLGGESREDIRVPLAEEELTAEKKMREAGEVKVRKDVVTEKKQITVPVTREEVHVERVPASADTPADTRFDEKTIAVPVREEEVEIKKRPVVREEVRVSKTRRQEERRADAEVRREEAHVDETGDIHRKDKGKIDDPLD
jgi:uncharacterized protein (TIGR02271 family)